MAKKEACGQIPTGFYPSHEGFNALAKSFMRERRFIDGRTYAVELDWSACIQMYGTARNGDWKAEALAKPYLQPNATQDQILEEVDRQAHECTKASKVTEINNDTATRIREEEIIKIKDHYLDRPQLFFAVFLILEALFQLIFCKRPNNLIAGAVISAIFFGLETLTEGSQLEFTVLWAIYGMRFAFAIPQKLKSLTLKISIASIIVCLGISVYLFYQASEIISALRL
jgi:hypothetical protein